MNTEKIADLPMTRFTPENPPFTNIGVDYFGPFICILFKKGDRSNFGNYRGISLLSVVGKSFAAYLLQRL